MNLLTRIWLTFIATFSGVDNNIMTHYLQINKEKPIIIAVLDSGYNPDDLNANLCRYGHRDFTQYGIIGSKIPIDRTGHGTDIVRLIDNQLNGINKKHYCFVIVKYFDTYDYSPALAGYNMIKAVKYLAAIRPSVLNISGGGSLPYKEEEEAILDLIKNGTIVVAAAGNNGVTLSNTSTFYPAMYHPDIVVVGGVDSNGNIMKSSNRGAVVDVYELGYVPMRNRRPLIGTSYATAIHTGKIVRNLIEKQYGRNVYTNNTKSSGRENVRWLYESQNISDEIRW